LSPRPVLVLVAVVLAGAAGAAPQSLRLPKVDVDFDAEADFSAFKIFAWKDAEAVAKDPQMHTRIVWYVERELEKKGLRKAKEGEKPDLLVRYYAKASQSLKGTPSQTQSPLPGGVGSLSTSVDFQKVVEGTLLLEMQRASDGKPVWRAASEYGSIDKKRLDAETSSAVRLLLSKYPPKK
jgi:hypothetical protein